MGDYATFCTAADQLGIATPGGGPDPWGIAHSAECLFTGQNCGKALVDLGMDVLGYGAGKLLKSGLGTDVEAASAAAGDSINPELKQLIGCAANSFVGSTPVLMADGTAKPIDEVKVGDKIANNLPGADPGTKDQTHTVTAVHITYTDRDYTDVTIDTGHGRATITGTAHHPYWDVTTRAWTDADRLHVGDHLQTSDGQTVTVIALRNYTTTAVTYNLTVNGLHTYYVVAANAPVLVHNACPSAIALGLTSTDANPDALFEFGLDHDATPWMEWEDPGNPWKTINEALSPKSDVQIHFNLDGIRDPAAWASDPQGALTAEELAAIRDAPASVQARVTWYLNGRVTASPFAK